MSDDTKVREAVEMVVAEAFNEHVRVLQEDIVTRVLERVLPLLDSSKRPGSNSLKSAIGAIEAGAQQTDILVALLDGSALFAKRTALFVLRGATAVGWQARGFDDSQGIRNLSLDASAGLTGSAIQQRRTVTGPVASFDRRLSLASTHAATGDCAVMPLIIRDRVAAVLYADGSREGNNCQDIDSIEILVRAAGLWIEIQTLRKASVGAAAQAGSEHRDATFGRQTAQAMPISDRGMAAMPPRSTVEQRDPGGVPHSGASGTSSYPTVAVAQADGHANQERMNRTDQGFTKAADGPSGGHPEDEVHKKARRFAKLLVDEIVLYNKAKVAEGRSHADLYDRLKDDIDKSRATYERRYAETTVATHDYFTQALITGLALDKAELLGPNFAPRAAEAV